MEEQGSKINWGKAIGGVAAVTGAAVLGVGLGGDALAGVLPEGSSIGSAASSAAETVNSAGESVASKIGLEGHGKAAAAVAGGALAVAGVAAVASSDKGDDEEEKMKEAQRKMHMLEAEQGKDINGDGVIGGPQGGPPPQDRGDKGRS